MRRSFLCTRYGLGRRGEERFLHTSASYAAGRSFLYTSYGVRPTWEERFLHTSARYAADSLDGSRARQTSGFGCMLTAGALRGREPSALVWTAAPLKHPLSRKRSSGVGLWRENGVALAERRSSGLVTGCEPRTSNHEPRTTN